jgi:hypothetical protein
LHVSSHEGWAQVQLQVRAKPINKHNEVLPSVGRACRSSQQRKK